MTTLETLAIQGTLTVMESLMKMNSHAIQTQQILTQYAQRVCLGLYSCRIETNPLDQLFYERVEARQILTQQAKK
jgi:hypothetical protein